MSTTAIHIPSSVPALRLLALAPHRLMFFIGAMNVLLAMSWWTVWLIDVRWQVLGLKQPAIPAGWLHAIIMQYHVLPSFIFGFLLTVFPRWMHQPAFERVHYMPVGLGLFGGQAFTLIGIGGGLVFLKVGAILTICGWLCGMALLIRGLYREGARTWHATSCLFALAFGLVGLLLYTVFLYHFEARVMFVAMKIATFAFLLPVYFTVCHRMVPFFSSCVIQPYKVVRPMGILLPIWALLVAHLWLELRHAHAWLWVVDVPLLLMFAALLWVWYPRGARKPPILAVLFISLAWLPIAFALYAAQSAWLSATGEFVLGRGPAHALFIGFFGSMLVAMVTRVTQGHSGRPLLLDSIAAFAFAAIQLVAITRVAAEIATDGFAWQALAAIGWLIAFLPWASRSAWVYLTPRRDGMNG